MDKKTRPIYMLPLINHLRQTKNKGLEKIFHKNEKRRKKAGVVVCTSDIKDFKIKATIRDKETHYKMIKGKIQ